MANEQSPFSTCVCWLSVVFRSHVDDRRKNLFDPAHSYIDKFSMLAT